MPGIEPATETVPFWQQISVFVGVGFAALVTAVQAYRKAKNEHDIAPSHAVFEAADIADMAPLRDIARTLGKVYPALESLDERMDEALRILRAQERDAEIAKEVEDRLRDERMKSDREARERDHGGRGR